MALSSSQTEEEIESPHAPRCRFWRRMLTPQTRTVQGDYPHGDVGVLQTSRPPVLAGIAPLRPIHGCPPECVSDGAKLPGAGRPRGLMAVMGSRNRGRTADHPRRGW